MISAKIPVMQQLPSIHIIHTARRHTTKPIHQTVSARSPSHRHKFLASSQLPPSKFLSNAPATKLYPPSLSSSHSRVISSREVSSTGTTTTPTPLQSPQRGKAPNLLHKVSRRGLFDAYITSRRKYYPWHPLPAQEEQVFIVRPATLSVLTSRERRGGLVAWWVRGVFMLLLFGFVVAGCEVAILSVCGLEEFGVLVI
jgi:hypothetical protein